MLPNLKRSRKKATSITKNYRGDVLGPKISRQSRERRDSPRQAPSDSFASTKRPQKAPKSPQIGQIWGGNHFKRAFFGVDFKEKGEKTRDLEGFEGGNPPNPEFEPE